jgi:hypothetical protein
LEIALLQLERGELLLLPLVQAFLRKLLLLVLGALGLDVADAGAEHLQRFLLLVEAALRLDAQLREFLDLLVEMRELVLADAHFLLGAGDFLPRRVAQPENSSTRARFVRPRSSARSRALRTEDCSSRMRWTSASAMARFLARGGDFLLLRGDAGVELLLLLARAVDFDLQGGDVGGIGVELMPRELGLELGQFLERSPGSGAPCRPGAGASRSGASLRG